VLQDRPCARTRPFPRCARTRTEREPQVELVCRPSDAHHSDSLCASSVHGESPGPCLKQ